MVSFRTSTLALLACSSLAVFTAPAWADEPTAPQKPFKCVCQCTPEQTSKAFTTVAKIAMPAVVFIKVETAAPSAPEMHGFPGGQNPFDPFGGDFFNRFFGFPGVQPQQPAPQLSQGSGFFVSKDGYIMTNCHVVKGADKITVVLNDGRELDATLVGMDTRTDIAIIKTEGKDFPFLSLGDSAAMEIGEWVVAIGSPFQLQASLTVGVISAKGRQDLRITDLEDFIQTDAAINPGNSGGPLLNLKSEVIGINTAIVSRSGGYMGIGFAVPSDMAKNVMKQIIDTGSVTRAFLGVSLQPIDKDLADAFHLERVEGTLITEVMKDSPAEKAGLKQGDIIIEYNGQPVKTLGGFRNEIALMTPGSTIKLKVNRKGQLMMIPVTLGTASDKIVAAAGVAQKVGIEVENITPDVARQLGYDKMVEGVVITKVKPGSPAAMAGIRPGFLILAINHQKIANVNDFNEALNNLAEDKRVLILARQGEVTRFYSLKIE